MHTNGPRQESGIVLIAVVIILLPVIVTVGAFSAAMSSRTHRLVDEVAQEKALLAAESGIDLSIWAGRIGQLQDRVTFGYQLSPDTSCFITPTHLKVDGMDNDGDGFVDEDDEDVFQVVSRGTYRGVNRNVAAYLGPLPRLPLNFPAAVTVMNPNVEIRMDGTPAFIGYDTNMDGTRADPSGDVPALAMTPPGTMSDLSREIDADERNNLMGYGGLPSMTNAPGPDITEILDRVENVADTILTNRRYSSYEFGNGPAGDATLAYRNGDVAFSGNTRGAGILVVTGDLTITGTFRYDGVVLVLGNINLGAGTAQIYGALVQGNGGMVLRNAGTLDVRYSSEALALANAEAGRYMAYNGWQELAR